MLRVPVSPGVVIIQGADSRSGSLVPASQPAARLVVARHGQTTWNRQGRIQGQSDPPLDTIGRQQARTLASTLTRQFRPSLVVGSTLQRAGRTAEGVARAAGSPVELRDDLREVDAGEWEGRLRAEVQAAQPDRYGAWRQGLVAAPGSTETLKDAGARVLGALVNIVRTRPDPDVIVVIGHGLSLQAALANATGTAAPHLGNGEWLQLAVSRDFAGRPG